MQPCEAGLSCLNSALERVRTSRSCRAQERIAPQGESARNRGDSPTAGNRTHLAVRQQNSSASHRRCRYRLATCSFAVKLLPTSCAIRPQPRNKRERNRGPSITRQRRQDFDFPPPLPGPLRFSSHRKEDTDRSSSSKYFLSHTHKRSRRRCNCICRLGSPSILGSQRSSNHYPVHMPEW